MPTITSKLCVVGDFAVGKTSTVERFVNQQFSDKYLTTIGIKVDTKTLVKGEITHKLVIWDIAGTDKFGEIEFSYLRGAAGYLLIVDGTRLETVSSALTLRQQISERFGDIPHVLLINKSDLKPEWELTPAKTHELEQHFPYVFNTSAKTGDEVDTAIDTLVSAISESASR